MDQALNTKMKPLQFRQAQFYQLKLYENLRYSYLDISLTETGLTTSNMHIEICDGNKPVFRSVGELLYKNYVDPKDELRLYLFDPYGKDFSVHESMVSFVKHHSISLYRIDYKDDGELRLTGISCAMCD